MSNPWKKIGAKILVRTLDGLFVARRGLGVMLKWVSAPLFPVGRFLFRYGFVQIYKVVLLSRRGLRRIFGPAKSRIVFLIANRYTVHISILLLALIVSTSSVMAREQPATVDTGSKTLLFAVLSAGSEDQNQIVEDVSQPILHPTDVSYLGNGVVRPTTNYDFDSEVFIPNGVLTTVGGNAVQSSGTVGGTSVAARTKTEDYIIQAGDTIGSIAVDYNISIQSILWANNLGPKDYLQIGQKIKIPAIDGVLHIVKSGDTVEKIAAKYSADVNKILAGNFITEETALQVGQEIIVPDGTPPAPVRVIVAPKPYAPIASIFKAPPSANVNNGTRFLWPTTSHVLTQYYGTWECVQGCRIHTGIDMAGNYSSPIYAADDGIVIFASWRTGYGNSVDIDHGGGYVTRYGHSSKLLVHAGEYVKRGQVIGMIGSTGYSTGPHLHFEIRIYNKAVNPISYLR